ncbi:hypothetical protein ACMD2_23188, partial [Ananas comosus]
VHSEHHEVVADLLQTSFLFSIPIDGPTTFSTSKISVQWYLRFEFFTTPEDLDLRRYEHPLLIEQREKGDWVLPISVYAPPLHSVCARQSEYRVPTKIKHGPRMDIDNPIVHNISAIFNLSVFLTGTTGLLVFAADVGVMRRRRPHRPRRDGDRLRLCHAGLHIPSRRLAPDDMTATAGGSSSSGSGSGGGSGGSVVVALRRRLPFGGLGFGDPVVLVLLRRVRRRQLLRPCLQSRLRLLRVGLCRLHRPLPRLHLLLIYKFLGRDEDVRTWRGMARSMHGFEIEVTRVGDTCEDPLT